MSDGYVGHRRGWTVIAVVTGHGSARLRRRNFVDRGHFFHAGDKERDFSELGVHSGGQSFVVLVVTHNSPAVNRNELTGKTEQQFRSLALEVLVFLGQSI